MSNDAIRTQTLQDQAIAWVVRAHASDMSDDDIIALSEWLEADPAHLAAYDAAERVWIGEAPAAETATVVDLASARAGKIKKPAAPSRRLWLIAGGMAAGLAALALLPGLWKAQAPLIYETATGQTREVALDDGTRLHLNSATRLEVRYARKRRDIVLDRGRSRLMWPMMQIGH